MEPLTIVQMLEKIDFSTGSVVPMFEAATGLALPGPTGAGGATFLGAHYGLVVNRGVSFPMDFLSGWKYRSRRVSRIVCVAESVRRVVIATGRVPAHKVGVIYAGVDLERFDPARTHPEVVRAALGIAGG